MWFVLGVWYESLGRVWVRRAGTHAFSRFDGYPAAHDALDTLAYHAHARPVQTVLHPGEAILVPKGWWHYALSLDPSITVMRNFYEKDTNVKDCVAMVTKHLAGAIAQVKATASR